MRDFSFWHFASLNSSSSSWADELIKTASFGPRNQLCLICSACQTSADPSSSFFLLFLLPPFHSTFPVAVRDLPLIWARVAGVESSNYAPLFGIFIILRTKRDFSRRELLVIVAPCVMFSVFFFILRCCFSCCDFSLLLFAPLMQNFNFNLNPVVALVVRIVCQLFPGPCPTYPHRGPKLFWQQTRAINFAQIFVDPLGRRWFNMAATWLCSSLAPSSSRWIVCIALQGEELISFTTLICWHWTLEACTEICNLAKGN